MPGPVTLRQAKAAHKAKGGPSVSERDLRILQREIQLDRRAWATKEREKSRLAARKVDEQQQRHKADEAARFLGTQRRCDKFGHKSSQFHLGAFFTKASAMATPPSNVVKHCVGGQLDEEYFLDDDSLFDAVQHVEDAKQDHVSRPGLIDEPLDWTDFLETGTQIERELGQPVEAIDSPLAGCEASQKNSFDSTGFDLTAQDVEALDRIALVRNDSPDDRIRQGDQAIMASATNALLCDQLCHKNQSTLRKHCEYSISQLERFVDEDIVLSQI